MQFVLPMNNKPYNRSSGLGGYKDFFRVNLVSKQFEHPGHCEQSEAIPLLRFGKVMR